MLEAVLFDTVINALICHEEYSYVFSYINDKGVQLQKKISYRYLDENKTEILFLRSDITEETRLEQEQSEKLRDALEEARHASAMKTEFLSNVSHDMRTPLNAILGYTDLAIKSENIEEVKEYLIKLDRAGNILLSLINDTLDLSKIENGAITLKPRPTRSGDIITKIVSAVQLPMEEKHIHFVIDDAHSSNVAINVDALRVQEIFINLLSNAIKFTPEKGEIIFTVECLSIEERYVHDRISVRDTGCGMSKDFIPKAFEPFSQERQKTTADVGGSGLGLSIVKKLITMMNGRIELESELGKGSVFTVYLDFERVQDEGIQENTVNTIHQNLEGCHVLLVDDNEMNIEIAKAVLEMRKMIVTCARNGKEACDKFAESNPGEYSVILMDIRMPVMNGHEASIYIRKMNRPDAKTIPIIAMSADAFEEDVKASLEAGINEHVAKPVNAETLYAVIAKVITKES